MSKNKIMIKILVNDGLEESAVIRLRNAGFDVDMNSIPQGELAEKLPAYDAIVVRSATKVRKELIEKCPNLRLIGRAGVGLDNIDVEYAEFRGIKIVNTPAASSRSVAELAIAHVLNISRFLHDSNRVMPERGNSEFEKLKKAYGKGMELEGKTIGIIGFGRIGKELGSIALGLRMHVKYYDPEVSETEIVVGHPTLGFKTTLKCSDLEEIYNCDVISLHVPDLKKAIIGPTEFKKMRKGTILVNASRGGLIDEDALIEALNDGTLMGAGLDVFLDEPQPREDILKHPKISLSPHIGASTVEAQGKVGNELADHIIAFFNK